MKRSRVVFSMLIVGLAMLAVLPVGSIALAQTSSTPATTADHAYLGVRLEDTQAGVIVRQIIPQSPAATAGLQVDDIIQKINDHKIANVYNATNLIDGMKVNDQITLVVSRDGQTQNITATLSTRPDTMVRFVPSDMPFDAFAYNSIDQTWRVYSLAENGDLHNNGLRMSDVITLFDGKAYNPADFQTWAAGVSPDATIMVSIQRAGQSSDIEVPAFALQALNILGNDNTGLLFNVIRPTINSTTAEPAIPSLPFNKPFEGIAYDSSAKDWNIFSIENNGALYNAGLRQGDQIMQFDGKAYDPTAFQTYRESLDNAATVTVTVQRGDNSMDMMIPAADLNALNLFNVPDSGLLLGLSTTVSPVWLGADLDSLTADFAQQHQISVDQGALVIGVEPDSPASQAGLLPNDVITAVGSTDVSTMSALDYLLANHQPGDTVALDVLRGSDTMKLNATLGEPEISGEISSLMPAL